MDWEVGRFMDSLCGEDRTIPAASKQFNELDWRIEGPMNPLGKGEATLIVSLMVLLAGEAGAILMVSSMKPNPPSY